MEDVRRQLTRVRRIAVALCLGLTFSAPRSFAESGTEKPGGIERVRDPVRGRGRGDGVYGRFNGDVSLELGAGVEAAFDPGVVRPLLVGSFSIYQSVGLYSSFRQAVMDPDAVLRLASAGVHLSPLFLLRWSKAKETGHSFFDLTLDSLTLNAGLHVDQLRGEAFGDPLGAEVGLGLGIPLFARANGLWLRTRGQLLTGANEVAPSAWLYLSYQGFLHLGILPGDP
jgi:hypothetical protein